MNNFENQLDAIRIKLYEETKDMDKEDIITNVNSHARKIGILDGKAIFKTNGNNKISEKEFLGIYFV